MNKCSKVKFEYPNPISKRVYLIVILLLGVWVRFHALARDVRFQPDEALFSTFARAAAINGDWMLPGALDKPPLAIYANALSMVFVGESVFSARLPGTFASILLMAVMWRLADALYQKSPQAEAMRLSLIKPTKGAKTDEVKFTRNHRLAQVAILLTVLSPYAITFSATALTDGLMLLFMVTALLMAVRGRWSWSGLWLGLAFASKQQALFYLPLILMLAWAFDRLRVRGLVRFLLMFGLCAGALVMWDAARGETSIFTLAAYNNDPTRLIRVNEIVPRLRAWLAYGQFFIGEGWLTAFLMVFALIMLLVHVIRQPRHRVVLIDLLLFTWLVGYFFVHWLVAFNTYDRYLLPALPVVILLVARMVSLQERTCRSMSLQNLSHRSGASPLRMTFMVIRSVASLQVVLGVLLFIGAWKASEGQIPVNNLGADYVGIDVVADYLNTKPVATVIYDRWLGWELGYYMGQWTDKRRVYYPTPDLLAQGALSLCESGARYFPAPARQPIKPYLETLRAAGFHVTLAYETPQFVVYEIIPAWADVSGVESSLPDRSVWCGDGWPSPP